MRLFKPPFVILLALCIAAGAYVYKPWQPAKEAGRFRLEKISKGSIKRTISANGTLNPVVLVNVGTQISGVINKLNVDFNDKVKKGQILAEIDPSLIDAQLEQSRANLANAQAAVKLALANQKRSEDLYAQEYIPKSELDQTIQALAAAQSQVAGALGQLKRDQTNKKYTLIASPVSGVVVSRNVDLGQTVAASFQTPTLFTIAQDMKQMQIDSTVAEADVGEVREGQPVSFTVDAYPERVFEGKVRRVRLDSKVLQNVVTYDVVVGVDNPEQILLPGMTAFINILIDEKNERLKLPLQALRFHPTEGKDKPGKRVYRLENGQLVAVPVKLGITDGKYAELIEGALKENDEIVMEDMSDKKPDAKNAAQGNFKVRAF